MDQKQGNISHIIAIEIKQDLLDFLKSNIHIDESNLLLNKKSICLIGSELFFNDVLDKLTTLLYQKGFNADEEDINAFGCKIENAIDVINKAIYPTWF